MAVLASAAAVFLPFWRLRPNRIARGQGILLASAEPLGFALLLGLWLAFVVLGSRQGQLRSRLAALASLATAVLGLALTAHASAILAGSSPIARVSLGPGFWFLCVASYAGFVLAERGTAAAHGRGPDAGGRAPKDAEGPAPGAAGGPARAAFRLACAAAFAGLAALLLLSGSLDALSITREWRAQSQVFALETKRHLALTASALLFGGIIGAAIGIAAPRRTGDRGPLFVFLNVVQTMPSLALFGILIIPLAALAERFPVLREWGIGGIGPAPALIALSLYAALPIARNTWIGLEGVPPSARDAGRGMGMGALQIFLRVELPLALPVALAGLRTAAVQAVGNVAIAALIGAGGLGVFIFQGLGQFAMDMVLAGTVPLIALALAADAGLGWLSRALTPRGLKVGAAAGEGA
ncbi:MAG TPA: ABC transporter permease [Rectinemataceae bacterium]|nr:ABC transporter permease [Rectinemataceae bacterium]